MNIGQALASKGRFGDTMVAHISPQEAMLLKMRGGKGTRNPKTGLPEFWNDTDFLASFGTGEGGYDEYLQQAGSNVPNTTPAASTTVLPPEDVTVNIGGGYSSPEGGDQTLATPENPYPNTQYETPVESGYTAPASQAAQQYEYQPSADQTWAVPGLTKPTAGSNIGGGATSPELGDMSMYQRGETGKPTTSNYKYFETGTDLYGPGVYVQTEDPTKYYSDMDIDTQKGYTLYTTEDGSMYYQDASGNKYTIDSAGKVSIGGKDYNVRKGDESKKYYGIRTTGDLSDPDYEGKYKTFETEPSKVSEWQDIQNGQGWKYRYVDGEIYFAQPGDDVTKEGYTGLTNDEVQNWYTYQGKNYTNLNQQAYENEYGTYDPGTYVNKAWAKGADGNYYVPVFTGSDVMMERMLRPGEDSGDSSWLGSVGEVMKDVFNASPYALAAGLTMGAFSPVAATAGGVGGTAVEAAAPTFLGGITDALSSAGSYLAALPSTVATNLGNLTWSSLAPSSLKAVAIPAAVGAGYSGMQSDWDLMEMLKGAGMGALGGYGMDRLLAGLKYLGGGEGGVYKNDITGNYNPDHGSYISEHPSELLGNQGIDAYGNIVNSGRSYDPTLTEVYNYKNDITGNYNPNHSAYISEHPTEILANQGLDPKFGVPVTDNVAYDPTLIEPNIVKSWEAYNANKNMIDQGFDLGELPNRGLVRLDNGGDNSYLLPERSISDPSTFISEHDSEILRNLGVERTPSIYYDQELLDKSLVPEIDIDNPMTWRSEHDVELLANQGMNPAGHIVSRFPFDPTLIDPETYALWEEYTRGDLMTDWLSNPFETIWNTGVYPNPYETLWNIDWDQYNGGPIGNAKYTDKDWSQYDGGPIGYESTPWDYISSAGSTIAEIAPSILKILGTGGTGGTGATGGSSTSTQYPSGSSSGGAAYTTAEGSSGSATGSAGREAGLASLKKIAAIQALQDAINKKFSGPLYYT